MKIAFILLGLFFVLFTVRTQADHNRGQKKHSDAKVRSLPHLEESDRS